MSVERAHRMIAVARGLSAIAVELAMIAGVAHDADVEGEVAHKRLGTIAGLLRAYAATIEEHL